MNLNQIQLAYEGELGGVMALLQQNNTTQLLMTTPQGFTPAFLAEPLRSTDFVVFFPSLVWDVGVAAWVGCLPPVCVLTPSTTLLPSNRTKTCENMQ